MKTTIGEIVELVQGKLVQGNEEAEITGFSSLDEASQESVSFYGNPKYKEQLETTRAGAVLVPGGATGVPQTAAAIEVENPILAFDTIIRTYGVKPPAFVPGVHATAYIAEDAEVEPGLVSVGPNATVASGVKIGKGSRIGSGAVVSENAVIGENCEISPNVTIREGCILGDRVILHPGVVIGADGFGFEFVDGCHRKIEQWGIVRVGNDVEIGASTTVDRARFGETVIGDGTKIDNQVQIGHNVRIGRCCIIVAQTGISGSTVIGDYVTLAAQCGIAGHLTIADQVTCGGRTGVIASIEEKGGTYFGYPARPLKEDRRESMRIKQLGSLIKRVKSLEEKSQEN